jgi:S-adenosylmethionine decarboxylase
MVFTPDSARAKPGRDGDASRAVVQQESEMKTHVGGHGIRSGRSSYSAGSHVLLDFSGVPREICEDDAFLLDLIRKASIESGSTVINSCRYRFGHNSPSGCTAFVMLDESHVSIHTYAERGLVAADVFTCGPTSEQKTDLIVARVKSALPHKEVRDVRLPRFAAAEETASVPGGDG